MRIIGIAIGLTLAAYSPGHDDGTLHFHAEEEETDKQNFLLLPGKMNIDDLIVDERLSDIEIDSDGR